MSARVLHFETLRALTIMLEVEEAIEEVWSMISLPNDKFSETIFEKKDPIEGF